MHLVILDIRAPDDLEAAFGRIAADAAFMLLDPMFFEYPHRIATLTIRRRLPLVTAERTFAEAGFLMSYGTARAEVLRLTAVFVDKILRGAKPADLPVEQSSRLELVVNDRLTCPVAVSRRPAVADIAAQAAQIARRSANATV